MISIYRGAPKWRSGEAMPVLDDERAARAQTRMTVRRDLVEAATSGDKRRRTAIDGW